MVHLTDDSRDRSVEVLAIVQQDYNYRLEKNQCVVSEIPKTLFGISRQRNLRTSLELIDSLTTISLVTNSSSGTSKA